MRRGPQIFVHLVVNNQEVLQQTYKKYNPKSSKISFPEYLNGGFHGHGGTPKSSILIRFSLKNHPIGVPPFMETPKYIMIYFIKLLSNSCMLYEEWISSPVSMIIPGKEVVRLFYFLCGILITSPL